MIIVIFLKTRRVAIGDDSLFIPFPPIGLMGLRMCGFFQRTLLVVTAIISLTSLSFAAERGTKAEAEALVKRTIAAIQADGVKKTYTAITSKDPRFIDRDLYPVVYDMDGTCLSHGANPRLVGKELIDVQDADEKYFVKERIQKAREGVPFWHNYKYRNPVTKEIEPKESYCEILGKTIVCAGVYTAPQ